MGKPAPIITPFRMKLLEVAHTTGGLAAPFLSTREESAAFAMTQMSEPLLAPTHWGPFDYVLTEAGISVLRAHAAKEPTP
jgi:hypothetical protein